MTAAPPDPDRIRSQHTHLIEGGVLDDYCWTCNSDWPCETYRLADDFGRLAADLAAAQAKLDRVSTLDRTQLANAIADRDESLDWESTYGEQADVALGMIRAALAGEGA